MKRSLLEMRTTPERLAREQRRPEPGEVELRLFALDDIEVRADAVGGLTGHAAVFDQPARIWDFDEVIRQGAFSKTINDGADVYAFWNHDTGEILGRRKNKTLLLEEGAKGLRTDIFPPDTQRGRETVALVRDGFVDKMSFGFEVVKQTWTDGADGAPDLREILEVKLYEVSPVPFPAYDGTSISVIQEAASGVGQPEPEPMLHSTARAVRERETTLSELEA